MFKWIARKPKDLHERTLNGKKLYECPRCKIHLYENEITKYCSYCGQKLSRITK